MVSIPRSPAWLSSLTAAQIKRVQGQLNDFTHAHTAGVTPLIVDGKNGQHTRNRVRQCKYLLGLTGKQTPQVTRRLMRQLAHPNWLIYSTPAQVKSGQQRRHDEIAHWKKLVAEASTTPHVGSFDGIPCAAYFLPILSWCRTHGWNGRLVSGYRTPAYSEHLCFNMCGRPSCPGTCAGRATNHAGLDPNGHPSGAVDVSDYVTFRRVVANCPLRPQIHNALPRDLVHFSPSGS